MFNSKLCIKYILLLVLFNFSGCANIENNRIKEFEKIIEKDFPDINTNSELIPLRMLKISTYEEIISNFDTKKKIENSKNIKPPDINRFQRYIPIGDFFFYSLISRNSITKHEFKTINNYISKYNNVQGEIKTKSSINSNFTDILKQKIKVEFQEFSYPIMYKNTLIFFRNNYSIYPALGTVGSGDWYIYKKEKSNWVFELRINQWTS